MLLAMIFLPVFADFIKMCSPPKQEAYFRKTLFANIVRKTDFPCPKWLQNHHFGGSISVLCCSKNNSFCRLSGKWTSWEALFSVTWIVACFLDYIFIIFSSFFKNVLPAKGASMIFKIDPQQFASKMLHFWAMMPLIPSGWNHLFDRFRSCVRSVRFLSAFCPPRWASKSAAQVCIISTDGLFAASVCVFRA